VLSGLIGALLARGLEPRDAASVGAHLHGRAGLAAAVAIEVANGSTAHPTASMVATHLGNSG
jgi:NAD(P)H-hydrate repair Nnr-like enzyme with NAD(P)H-hydrate dehydratase domain